MAIHLVTDSTADLPPGAAERLGVHVVPLYVLFGPESYRDGVNLTQSQFFDKLVVHPSHPSTSQPTPEDFLKVYEQLDGPILSVHIASSLSGTCNSARQAARLLDDPTRVRVFDSDSVTSGLGLMVLAAQEALASGLDLDAAEARLRDVRASLQHYFTVETLEFLARGGRIGKAQALLGGLLKIKPILTYADHAVSAYGKAFGFEQALQKILGLVEQDHRRQPIRRLCVAHGKAPDTGRRLREAIAERLGGAVELHESEIGAVVGAHVGPGAVGVFYHA